MHNPEGFTVSGTLMGWSFTKPLNLSYCRPLFSSCSYLTDYSFNTMLTISLKEGKENGYQPLVKNARVRGLHPGESSPWLKLPYTMSKAMSLPQRLLSKDRLTGDYKDLSIWSNSKKLERTTLYTEPNFLVLQFGFPEKHNL